MQPYTQQNMIFHAMALFPLVSVVAVVPSLFQPFGDAAVLAGSVSVPKPSRRVSFVIGRTRY